MRNRRERMPQFVTQHREELVLRLIGRDEAGRDAGASGHIIEGEQHLGQQAFVPGVEMRNNDIGHPGRRRKRAQELANCFESSGRGSDAHDG